MPFARFFCLFPSLFHSLIHSSSSSIVSLSLAFVTARKQMQGDNHSTFAVALESSFSRCATSTNFGLRPMNRTPDCLSFSMRILSISRSRYPNHRRTGAVKVRVCYFYLFYLVHGTIDDTS